MNLKYKFTCGCVVDKENVLFDYVSTTGGRKHPICPEHRERIAGKIILCKTCGEWEEVSKKASHTIVCSKCREEHNRKVRARKIHRRRGQRQKFERLPKTITGEPKAEFDPLAFLDKPLRMPTIEDYPGLMRLMGRI